MFLKSFYAFTYIFFSVQIVCAQKYVSKIFENGNYFYKIEGALFIVSILNSSKAFGYHLKKQVGQTLGAKGSKVELFWGGFSRISSKLIYCFSIGLGFKTLYCHPCLYHSFQLIKRL